MGVPHHNGLRQVVSMIVPGDCDDDDQCWASGGACFTDNDAACWDEDRGAP
jgi:hypothetical protein